MLGKSKFMNTQISPDRKMKKHFSSNITTIGLLDKMMKSWSLNIPRLRGDTKLWETRNNFEDINEAINSESKGSTHKHYLEDKEQSNTNIERDILNISAIVERKETNKKKRMEDISFESEVHDIYNPNWSSWKCDSEKEESIPDFREEKEISPKKFINDQEITLKDYKIK